MECYLASSFGAHHSLVSFRESACYCKKNINGSNTVRPLYASFIFRKLKTNRKQSLCFKSFAATHPVTNANTTLVTADLAPLDLLNFVEVSKKGNLIPLYRSIFSDHLTPVLAYRCLVNEDDREAPSFLFESVEQGHKGTNVGRFSIVGAQPSMEIVAKENSVTIMDHEQGTRKEEIVEDPMTLPPSIMADWKPVLTDELPAAFCGGWVGYFSYDSVRYVEKRKLPFSEAPKDDRGLPDMHLGLYNDVVVFDHVEKRAYVIHWVRVDRYSCTEEAFWDGQRQLDILVSRVQDIDPPRLSSGSVKLQTGLFGDAVKKSNMTELEYKKAVSEAQEHIAAGDIFQIVLSQRFERRTFADPFEVYRALRVVNPSPYMIYLQARGCILVASSPEILTRIKEGKVINRPLAGTRRRGKTEIEDEMLEKELLNDEKECAEHIMLVDLGRNDVGKISKPGSVKVERLMNVERYSHVMHISSTVVGELREDLTSWDALRAALPVGTVSGAPKVKAMELIDEYEPTRRGPYGGGIGGISYNGDMDIALALRTMVFPTGTRYDTMYSYKDVSQRREWVVHLQSGAGIVAGSNPDDEYKECINKAAGLGRAIDLAESTFVNS
ncbi:anthranilate synthase alpha subunit 1, chloroplastic [Cryptomeria japonica]|uniref:anthranilate synthase alpha subunit 1, chloroplastic n=1 Tax=Cryptomeria japonica TaxID=3369 RepID=UPI0027DAA9BF|nr:anthranilate synthase alpha subunit 1, chloroplastic [Cryptomeria japonica]XP_057865095.2 anthranilate synthase alpha subunit 1, chloroplastic [Cryptomeria japonica]XP_057865096.2 anthranilate synthase alpha subunit 1, chloroplastic [Cryptomeria japonica]XP_057865097.2 anthranilate synthase alpha subunit 1, chloroplastic [Cryptomeria japonica]